MFASIRLRAFGALGDRPSAPALVLVLCLAVDVLLIAGHVALRIFDAPANLIDLSVDRGYSEFFQYVKILWMTLILLIIAIPRRSAVLFSWAAVCGYYGLDDALSIHEQAGFVFAGWFPGLGSMAVHIGELLWLAAVGVILLLALVLTHIRAAPDERAVSAVLVALFALLVFFGIVLDAVHHLFLVMPGVDGAMTVLEDGGELITASFIVAFLVAVYLGHRPRLTGPLARLVGGGRR